MCGIAWAHSCSICFAQGTKRHCYDKGLVQGSAIRKIDYFCSGIDMTVQKDIIMRLKSLQIKNFRNYKDYNIQLGGKTTILIGKNGSGKTNLISAMVKSLSFIFSKQKDQEQYDFIASSDQSIKGYKATDARYGLSGNGFDYIYPVSIEAEGLTEQDSLLWKMEQETAKSGLKDSLYKNAYNSFWNYYNTISKKPVFAYFSDSFPHIKTNMSQKMKERLESGNPLPQNSGYYKWDEETNCVDIWVQYFTMQWMNNKMQFDAQKDKYVKCVVNTLRNFSRQVADTKKLDNFEIKDLVVELRGKTSELIVEYNNGSRVPFANLPQGYRRIYSIVFDIANRSYMLNGNCTPEGIVLIDEIELHLHPSLAKDIYRGFRETFPRIQFIISTHSPLVITNYKQDDDNVLYKLYYDEESGFYKNERILDIYGIDYNSSLVDVMETPHTNV